VTQAEKGYHLGLFFTTTAKEGPIDNPGIPTMVGNSTENHFWKY
jgi:hypothetical protein